MLINVILFLMIGISCYLITDLLISKKINEKISKYLKYKNEKYFEELIRQNEKKQKIKITTKINIIQKINVLIEKATQGILTTWIVYHIGPLKIVRYYGEG